VETVKIAVDSCYVLRHFLTPLPSIDFREIRGLLMIMHFTAANADAAVNLLLSIITHPIMQHSLWEETGVPGENPRLSVED
jgi:hypothetical protein